MATEIDPRDKQHSALAATEEAQDVSRLNQIVVPPPAFTDPENPSAAAGSVNMSVNTHPMEISDDYGADVGPGEDDVRSPIDTHAAEMALDTVNHPGRDDEAPEDREEWQKKHWVDQAKEYGLSGAGNTDAVKDRVEEYESAVEAAKAYQAHDWQDEIDDADNTAELEQLRALYDRSGADYSTVVEAFESRATELNQA